jgi:hypothetical protein
MEHDGILNAWTTKALMKRAKMIAMTRASIFSRILPLDGFDWMRASAGEFFFNVFDLFRLILNG